jgi:hypothetical protein
VRISLSEASSRDGNAALRALVVEYVRHAELLDAIPMAEPML